MYPDLSLKPDCVGTCPLTFEHCESSGCGNGCIKAHSEPARIPFGGFACIMGQNHTWQKTGLTMKVWYSDSSDTPCPPEVPEQHQYRCNLCGQEVFTYGEPPCV